MITGYYNALPFVRQSLMMANSPWSGNYVVNNPVWVTGEFNILSEIWMIFYNCFTYRMILLKYSDLLINSTYMKFLVSAE